MRWDGGIILIQAYNDKNDCCCFFYFADHRKHSSSIWLFMVCDFQTNNLELHQSRVLWLHAILPKTSWPTVSRPTLSIELTKSNLPNSGHLKALCETSLYVWLSLDCRLMLGRLIGCWHYGRRTKVKEPFFPLLPWIRKVQPSVTKNVFLKPSETKIFPFQLSPKFLSIFLLHFRVHFLRTDTK